MLSTPAAMKAMDDEWNLSNPKPGHTTGGSGRGGARRSGGACAEGQDADGSVRPEDNHPFCPPGHRRQLYGTYFPKHEQRKPYVNRWRNKASG